MKKGFVFVFAIMIGLSTYAYDFAIDGIFYNITSLKELTVEVTNNGDTQLYRGYSGNIVVPSFVKYNDYEFKVTSIGDWAFYICPELISVQLPSSIKSIGTFGFGHTGISEIIIPDSVETMGNDVLHGCKKLTKVVLGKSLKEVPRFLCWECDNLEEIKIPSNINTIRRAAFSGCKSLYRIILPEYLTEIEPFVFDRCASLRQIITEMKNPFELSENFSGLTYLEGSLIVPLGCKDAYAKCKGWDDFINVQEYIVFSDLLVKEKCLSNWDLDKNEYFTDKEASSVYSLGNVFSELNSIGNFEELKYFISLKEIGDYAFYKCDNLISIILPDSVSSIGNSAFEGCKKLDNISFPESVTTIGSHAFSGCESLAGVLVLPSKLDVIHPYTFNSCKGLTDIIWSSTIKQIEKGAFANCENLSCLNFPDHILEIGDSAFYDNNKVMQLILPNKLLSIGRNAFSRNSNITKLFIPNSINNIGLEAFSEWNKLDTIYTYIDKPFTIDNSVFSERYKTAILYIPKGTKSDYESVSSWNEFKYIVESGKVVISIIDTVRIYGDENPDFLYTTNGVELVGCPTINCTADKTSDTGLYEVTMSLGTIKNDTVIINNGYMSIDKAKLLASLGDYCIEQGAPIPVYEIVYDGFKNEDNESVIDTLPTASCSIPADNAIGVYDIKLSGGEDNNYYFEYRNGTLTITEPSSIDRIMKGNNPFNIYTMSGVRVRNKVFNIDGLTPGYYIIESNGRYYKMWIKK